MVELAGGMGYRQANASFTGPGKTPWNPDYWSGGSSSGPGSAVAAGLVPFAIGSENPRAILPPPPDRRITRPRPPYRLLCPPWAVAPFLGHGQHRPHGPGAGDRAPAPGGDPR